MLSHPESQIDLVADLGSLRDAVRSASSLPSANTALDPPPFVDLFQQIIDGLPDQVALMDEDWNILIVNEAWATSAARFGYADLLPGTNYLRFCQSRSAEGHSPAAVVTAGIAEIDAGGRSSFNFVYHGRDRWEGHAFQFNLQRLEIRGHTYAIASRHEITELLELRRLREDFSRTLIEGQAADRRRIAREIHDSTLQLLAALGMALGQFKRAHKSSSAGELISDIEALLREAQNELRSISFLAHPPAMKELGLGGALKALVEGFERRTGLSITLKIEVEHTLSWRAAETALYRIVQEGLSNVHRHSQATRAAVTFTKRKTMTHLVIADDGVGMPQHARQGIGLTSMRERLAELGGRLFVRSGFLGTAVIASIPSQSHIRTVGDLAGVQRAGGTRRRLSSN